MFYIFFLSLAVFSFFRLGLLLLFFQQKEYRNVWFLKFACKGFKLIDRKLTALIIFIYAMQLLLNINIEFLLLPLFYFFANRDYLVLKKAKKKLSITSRVKRIFAVSVLLLIGVIYYVNAHVENIIFQNTFIKMIFEYFYYFISSILTIQLLPFSIVIANLILTPYEKYVQNKFYQEALIKLRKINPIVIGITGSMGKTSTKHILSHILSGNLPVLLTPGSVNTKMGITRIIREKLNESHKYFVVEMGAYFKGSIKTLCDFVEPKYGIITAIGDSHYEYFKSKENVASAKFELGDAVKKNGGILVINQTQMDNNLIPTNLPLIKINEITNLKQTKEGLFFTYKNEDIFVPIYGIQQATNIAVAIELAMQIGMSFKTIITTLKTLPQINHRLEVIKRDNNITIIDDAYNSNFEGFKAGLELLQPLTNNGESGRRILITPGMVELGKKHNESHYEIGKITNQKTDIIVLVNSKRIPTFIKGINENGIKINLVEVEKFTEAQEWMNNNLKNGDVVLLENDLPDVYENNIKL